MGLFSDRWVKRSRQLGLGLLGLSLAFLISAWPIAETSLATERGTIPVEIAASSDPLAEGRSMYAAGRYADAIALWQRALEQAQDVRQQVMVLNHLSSAYQALSHWEAARDSIENSLELLNQSPQPAIFWAQALNTQASLFLSLGQAESALATWQQAEHYYDQADDITGTLGSQINQAEALQNLGFYRRARQQLTAVNQQLSNLPDSAVKVTGLHSLGKTLQLIGEPQESYAALAEGLAIAKELNVPDISPLLLSIGKLATEVESADIALSYFEAAQDAAVSPLDQLQARLAQLNLYIQQQEWSRVAILAPQIQQRLDTLSPGRTSVYATINFAHHLSQVGPSQLPLSKQDINALLTRAVQAAHVLQDARAEAHALVQMGKLYSQTAQKREALTLTEQSLSLARSIQADDVISQSAWQLGGLLKQQGKRRGAIAAYSEAVEALQSLRGDLVAVNQDVQFSYREQVEPVYRELVALLLEEKTQPALKHARDVLEALQVAELDNFFREACLDLQTNQIDQIDPDATVVYSIMLPDRLAVIYSKAGQPLQAYETPVEATTVQQTLRSYLSATHPSADRTQRLKKAQQIYNLLIRPAEPSLPPEQTLVFVLDGLLRNIPIAALHDGEHYLIEKYAVALSPGLQLMQARALDQQNIQALIGGISEPRGQFSALPAVESELKNIANTVSSSTLLNQRFTRDAIVDNLKSGAVDVVHLATHGQFSSNFNDTFFLTWDGTININELSEILRSREDNRNQAIELLTLSACETAAGDERAILGLAGLAVRSGARATVATLWPIKDEAAAKMMTTFYHSLSDTAVSKAEALRQAQLSLLHDRDFEDPFFWSAYVLIGNWI